MPYRFVPLGRLSEVAMEPNAELLAYTVQGWDARIVAYKSRKALEAFCKDGSLHNAVIKEPRHPNMISNRNTQRPK